MIVQQTGKEGRKDERGIGKATLALSELQCHCNQTLMSINIAVFDQYPVYVRTVEKKRKSTILWNIIFSLCYYCSYCTSVGDT